MNASVQHVYRWNLSRFRQQTREFIRQRPNGGRTRWRCGMPSLGCPGAPSPRSELGPSRSLSLSLRVARSLRLVLPLWLGGSSAARPWRPAVRRRRQGLRPAASSCTASRRLGRRANVAASPHAAARGLPWGVERGACARRRALVYCGPGPGNVWGASSEEAAWSTIDVEQRPNRGVVPKIRQLVASSGHGSGSRPPPASDAPSRITRCIAGRPPAGSGPRNPASARQPVCVCVCSHGTESRLRASLIGPLPSEPSGAAAPALPTPRLRWAQQSWPCR